MLTTLVWKDVILKKAYLVQMRQDTDYRLHSAIYAVHQELVVYEGYYLVVLLLKITSSDIFTYPTMIIAESIKLTTL